MSYLGLMRLVQIREALLKLMQEEVPEEVDPKSWDQSSWLTMALRSMDSAIDIELLDIVDMLEATEEAPALTGAST